MSLDIEYYNRFPTILKDALINGRVCFPQSLQREYMETTVYRGVSYSANKQTINKNDFLSNIERNITNPLVPVDYDDISSYSCSCYLKIDAMRLYTKFPRKNRAIAKGIINKEFGPIDVNNSTSHIDLYLFEDVDPSAEFEVIEKWEKSGLE